MSEVANAPIAGDTKPCKVCGETIKKTARVCIHCNNYQDWRAELNISGTILSLLVALFGVLTVALPAIKTFITPVDSNLTISYQGATDQLITLLVTNTGIRPGTVRYPSFVDVSLEGDVVEIPLKMKGVEGSAIVVEPGKSILLELVGDPASLSSDEMQSLKTKKLKDQCQLLLSKTDFTGGNNTAGRAMPIQCIWIGDFLDQVKSFVPQSSAPSH
jgi:hypothetical protein